MKLDFTNVKEFAGYPPGEYHLTLADGSVEETGGSSKYPENPYLNVEFNIEDGKYEGKPMYTNIMLPPYEPFMLFGLLKAHGVPEEELRSGNYQLGDYDGDDPTEAAAAMLEALLSMDIEVLAVVGKKKGQDSTQIQRFKEYDETEWTPEDDSDILPG